MLNFKETPNYPINPIYLAEVEAELKAVQLAAREMEYLKLREILDVALSRLSLESAKYEDAELIALSGGISGIMKLEQAAKEEAKKQKSEDKPEGGGKAAPAA